MDYGKLKLVADSLIAKFKQGEASAADSASTPGATPLDPPTVSTSWLDFDATAFRGVSSKYLINRASGADDTTTTLLETDLQAIVEADAPISVGQIVRLDGVSHTIVRIDNIPAIGTIVARRMFVRG